MRALRLDFHRSRRRVQPLGLAVLAAGAAAAVFALWQHHEASRELEFTAAKVADYQRMSQRTLSRVSVTGAGAKAQQQEVDRANVLLAQITLPWGALFKDLERATRNDVALLAIQPDAAGRQVRIGGEARSFDAMLAFIARLEELDPFANVFLTGHTLRVAGALRPVSFSLVADWVRSE